MAEVLVSKAFQINRSTFDEACAGTRSDVPFRLNGGLQINQRPLTGTQLQGS